MAAPVPPTPAEIAEIERVTIHEMHRAPADAPFDTRSIALHLKHAYPQLITKRTCDALRAVLRKVACLCSDRTHIVLKPEYRSAAESPAPRKIPTKTSHTSPPAEADLDLVYAIVRRGALPVALLIQYANAEDGSGRELANDDWERWWKAIHWLEIGQWKDGMVQLVALTFEDENESNVIVAIPRRRSARFMRARDLYLDPETSQLKASLLEAIRSKCGEEWDAYVSVDGYVVAGPRNQSYADTVAMARLLQRRFRALLCRIARKVLGSDAPRACDFYVWLPLVE